MHRSHEVYFLRPSTEPLRPQIMATDRASRSQPWQALLGSLDARAVATPTQSVSMFVRGVDGLSWDLYALGGTLGVYSSRAIKIMGKYLDGRFSLWPVTLNDAQYFILAVESRVQALDLARSKVVFFPGSDKIMLVRSYVFDSLRVPEKALFCIDEVRGELFCTRDPMAELNAARLNGFEFSLASCQSGIGTD
jgi:hypothetical protein